MFNNVVKLSNDNCCGGVGMAVGHTYTWNNTVLSYSSSASNSGLLGCYQGAGAPARSCSLENNVASTSNQLANWTNASFDSGSPDYNVYSDCQGTSCFSADGAGECGQNYSLSQFANYRSCTGAEAHSIAVASAKLNADGSPQAGSPVLAAGTNLTALCTGDLTPLCSDIRGALRPLRMPPDAGAYQRETAAIGAQAIGRVRLGASQSSVERFYGRSHPHRMIRPLFGLFALHGVSAATYRVHRGRLDVSYLDGTVVAVSTTSLDYTTRSGFGVGANVTARSLAAAGFRACGAGGLVRRRDGVATAIRASGSYITSVTVARSAIFGCIH